MVRVLAFLIPAVASFVAAAPIRFRPRAFAVQNYADFQISDGVAGKAQEEAAAVFVTPFDGLDLATVSDQDQNNVETMRQAAESAETEGFNPAIKAATGADADALQVGKIKNKVLKLTGEVQVLKIKLAKAQAAGDDTASIQSKLDAEQTKLNKNIATDVASAGQTSKGVTVGSSGATASSAISNSSSQAASTASTKGSASVTSTKDVASTTSSAATADSTAATNTAAVGTFQLEDYADFQISDGFAGNADEEAAAIFVTPFEGQDLATVSDQTQKDVETMRQAAEAAETDKFNPAIEAATGADADALQVGKIKNKVLKLTAEVQGLQIKLAKAKAAGSDTTSIESQLTEEQTKLNKNIATDKASAGQASKSVV